MSYGVAAVNYTAYPGSFIGRQIAYFRVRFADTKNGTTIDYENYTTYIRIIQTQAELILAGVPRVADNWGTFIVGLAYDTANNDGTGALASTITELLQEFDADAVLTRVWMVKDLWMEEGDYLDYINANWDTTTTPNVYGHGTAEQDEFNVQWANYI